MLNSLAILALVSQILHITSSSSLSDSPPPTLIPSLRLTQLSPPSPRLSGPVLYRPLVLQSRLVRPVVRSFDLRWRTFLVSAGKKTRALQAPKGAPSQQPAEPLGNQEVLWSSYEPTLSKKCSKRKGKDFSLLLIDLDSMSGVATVKNLPALTTVEQLEEALFFHGVRSARSVRPMEFFPLSAEASSNEDSWASNEDSFAPRLLTPSFSKDAFLSPLWPDGPLPEKSQVLRDLLLSRRRYARSSRPGSGEEAMCCVDVVADAQDLLIRSHLLPYDEQDENRWLLLAVRPFSKLKTVRWRKFLSATAPSLPTDEEDLRKEVENLVARAVRNLPLQQLGRELQKKLRETRSFARSGSVSESEDSLEVPARKSNQLVHALNALLAELLPEALVNDCELDALRNSKKEWLADLVRHSIKSLEKAISLQKKS